MNKKYVFIDNVRDEKMRLLWQKILEDNVDPFSLDNLSKYHSNPILMESKHWIVTANDHPYPGSKHHLLFITKYFYEQNVSLIPPEVYSDLYILVDKITKELKITGYTVWARFGDPIKTNSTVLHFHAQLIEPEDGYVVPAWYGIKKN